MKTNAAPKKSFMCQSLVFCNNQGRGLVILAALALLTSCSSSNDVGYDIAKQVERQQAQYDLISEPVPEVNRTAVEYEELGDRHLVKGDINRAYIYYIKGLGVEHENVSLRHKQGALLLRKKKTVEAEAVYNMLLTIDAQDALALEGRGKTYFAQGQFVEAERDFLAALDINAELVQSHEFLGLLYSRRQEYEKAIKQFETVLAAQPLNISVSNNLAVTYYLNGDFNEAVRLLSGVQRISPNRKIYNNLALAYFQLGLYDKAMESFKRGSENNAVAYNNMGYELLNSKKYKEAIKAFEKALALNPKFYPSAQKNLDLAKCEMAKSLTSVEK
jgi:tetratricopeptide (TPR) repeat protein